MTEDKAARWPNCDYCTTGRPHPGCTAHTKNGVRKGMHCANGCRAGELCRVHGGNASQVKAARGHRDIERKARAQMTALGQPVADVTPTQALLDLIHAKAGEVAWLRAKVQELDEGDLVWGVTREKTGGDDAGTTREAKPSIWWAMLRTAEDQLANYCTRALTAGIEERRVRLAESQGALVADAIRRILTALDLSPAQLDLVPVVVPRELRAIAGGGAA